MTARVAQRPSRMGRGVVGLLGVMAAAAASWGCTADLEERCLSGPCGQTELSGQTCPAGPDLPCPVYVALADNCATCHGKPPLVGSPFPLTSVDEVEAEHAGEPIWKRMQAVLSPDASLPMPPTGQLDDGTRNLLLDWLETCETGACERLSDFQP